MYYSGKSIDVSTSKQNEDKYFRFDYTKTRIDVASALRGYKEIIKDSRWFDGRENGEKNSKSIS